MVLHWYCPVTIGYMSFCQKSFGQLHLLSYRFYIGIDLWLSFTHLLVEKHCADLHLANLYFANLQLANFHLANINLAEIHLSDIYLAIIHFAYRHVANGHYAYNIFLTDIWLTLISVYIHKSRNSSKYYSEKIYSICKLDRFITVNKFFHCSKTA